MMHNGAMPDCGTALVIRARVCPEDHETLREYHRKNCMVLRDVRGYRSMTVWESTEDPEDFLMLLLFDDDRSADEGLKATTEAGPLVESMKRVCDPPDVRRTRLVSFWGPAPCLFPLGTVVSVSFRTADPGYGSDLVDELDRIFSELSFLPGFLGCAIGRNSALREEVVGLAFWRDEPSFRQSLPHKHPHQVRAYRKVMG
ncbi:MAG TPA: hypothetical protein DER07_05855 [Armatimonadetes bacterium]|nr:hypothetical protein [Armatimonadota bacterium]